MEQPDRQGRGGEGRGEWLHMKVRGGVGEGALDRGQIVQRCAGIDKQLGAERERPDIRGQGLVGGVT